MAIASLRPRKNSPLNLKSSFKLFPISYNLLKENFGVFKWLLAPSAILALWNTFTRFVDGESWDENRNSVFGVLFGANITTGSNISDGGFALILSFLLVITEFLILIASLKIVQGHHPTLKELINDLLSRWLWLKLFLLSIVLGIVIVIGFILLIIPGIILLWRFFLLPYALIDQKSDIDKAVSKSLEVSRGHFRAVMGVVLITILLSFTQFLPAVGSIIAFLLTSAYTIAPAYRYKEIQKNLNS